ncbi:MAG: ferritin [Bacteroidales bacterium]
MLSKKLEETLNHHVNAEFYAAYLYLSMSANFANNGLNGIANWYAIQAKEELAHAMQFYKYILERMGKVILEPIAEVVTEWSTPMMAFKDALAHEHKVTERIHDLMDLAVAEKDYATQSFLMEFVNEQVEEEKNATNNIEKLILIGGKDGANCTGEALYLLDKEMNVRTTIVE